ncbi:response regulator transcription factor [Sunxiuqinia dokdonensis]|uniref:response regulator transcription factor n=1 Tax=Sunxiuqinia dokdonensis TaxID=1409788 RepID=UPI00069DAAF6|nr:response regulator [Sunxiuqinia dokdonensis]
MNKVNLDLSSKKTVVIVEDNDLLSKVLEYRMEKDGFQVEVFNNGEEAIEFLSSNSFDLLITDLYMPFMNGSELIKYVRNNISATVPIMAISSTHEEDVIGNIFNIGANDFIVKPFRAGELSVRIKRLIR